MQYLAIIGSGVAVRAVHNFVNRYVCTLVSFDVTAMKSGKCFQLWRTELVVGRVFPITDSSLRRFGIGIPNFAHRHIARFGPFETAAC